MGHAIVRNEPLHGMRLKGHEVMRKEIFALSVESSLSQHENQNEKFDSALINRTFITVLILLYIPFLANLQSLNFRSWSVWSAGLHSKMSEIFFWIVKGGKNIRNFFWVVEIDKIDSKFCWRRCTKMSEKEFALVQKCRKLISRKHKNVRKFSGTEMPSLFP